HFELSTGLRAGGNYPSRNSLLNPNLAYNGVQFFSANPNTNQTLTSVVKFTSEGVTFQPVGNTSGDQQIQGRDLLNFLYSLLQNHQE
ncbi:MAG: hypothetical protein HRU40_21050, partial [Saprospiraceae bacterium]|nr:hypothetical protein [Saprospiraceae bacterium]